MGSYAPWGLRIMRHRNKLIQNVYYMLSYAYRELKRGEYETLGSEEFENIHELFAAILSAGVARQLKQGLHREYESKHDDLLAIRGKIDMPGTIANTLNGRKSISCDYDELTANNPKNQVLKAACFALVRKGDITSERRSELRRSLLLLSDVDDISPLEIDWTRVMTGRVSQSYEMLLVICRLLFDGLLMSEEDKEYKLARFFNEEQMYRLYEKFILEYYRKEHSHLSVSAPQIEWALDDDNRAFLPIMQADITISDGESCLIIDAKYYTHNMQSSYGPHSMLSGNLYQIFTYVKNRELQQRATGEKVSGMLLYAQTEDNVQPDETYQMSGNQISVKTLDLNQDFAEISKQLDDIVTTHFHIMN